MTLSDIKNLPVQIKLVTAFNIIVTLAVLYIIIRIFPIGWWLISMSIFLMTANYYLILGKKLAFIALLIWYIMLMPSIQMTSESFSFWYDLRYGHHLHLGFELDSGEQRLLIDVYALAAFLLLYSCRKYFRKKTVIDEIDKISVNED